MLNKNSLIPLYVQLENLLLEKIDNGELKAGDLVPSENELSQRYEISRMTAKKAIDNLMIKGLVERVKGKGTFILKQEKKIELPLNRLRGFTQKVKELGLLPLNLVLVFEEKKADTLISKYLNINVGDKVWYMERIRQIDEIPAVLEQSYISVDLFPNLTKQDLEKSKFDYIEKQGFKIKNSDREISAEIPNDYVATSLHLKRSEPVLVAKCITYLDTNEVLEYSTIYYNQKKYKFKIYAEN